MVKVDTVRLREMLRMGMVIVGGNALLAFVVTAFIVPHGIIMGGATGIGIIVSRLLPLNIASIVLVLNLLSLILGAFALGRKFLAATIASSLLYPFFLTLVEKIPGITNLTGNSLLAAIFGGGLAGIGLGMVMRVGASTGGMDVVNLAMHKWLHIPVSVLVYVTDFFVLGGQVPFSNPEQILYGIVLLILEAFALDRVMLMGQSQIQIFIISSRYDEIRSKILEELLAGATMVCIETGLTGQQQRGVLCVIPPRKLYAAKELIHSIDPNAFLTITQVKEVRGQGFSMERQYVRQEQREM